MKYPAFLVCPKCGDRASWLTCVPPHGISLVACRHTFRRDSGKPSASKHLITCQHCDYSFTLQEATIITT